ncbi:Protein of unknown function [Pyronema omphalodes CBS 100304]|uniref:Uncharacterized protein n=1 Tax=Pyronema omphalodes (strain CBS 100304) TaxID=1076935 RepID=U4L4J4_PYROM|nr:Protein of unknown function [Pyronema omphalodes CBS 100304]
MDPLPTEFPTSPRLEPSNPTLRNPSPLQLPPQDPVGAMSQGLSELAVSPATGPSALLSLAITATSTEFGPTQQTTSQASPRPQSTTTSNSISQSTISWNNDESFSLDGMVVSMPNIVAKPSATLFKKESMDDDLMTDIDMLTKIPPVEQHITDASTSQANYPTDLTTNEGIRRVRRLALEQYTKRILNKPGDPPKAQPASPSMQCPQVQPNDSSTYTGMMSTGIAPSEAGSVDDDYLIDPYRAETPQPTPQYGSSLFGSKSPVTVKRESSQVEDSRVTSASDKVISFNQDRLRMLHRTHSSPIQPHPMPRHGSSLFESKSPVTVKRELSPAKDRQMTGVPDEGIPFNQDRLRMIYSSPLRPQPVPPYGGSLFSSNDPVPMQCEPSQVEDCQMTSVPDGGIPFNQDRLRMLQRTPSPPLEPPPDQILKKSSSSENAIPLAFNRLTGQVFSTPKIQIKMEKPERPSNNQQSVGAGFHQDRLQMLAWSTPEPGPSELVPPHPTPMSVQRTLPHLLGPSTPTAANTPPPPVTDHKKKQRGKKRSPRHILFEDCPSPSDDHVTRRLSFSQVVGQKRQRSEDGGDHSRSPCGYRDSGKARSQGLFHDHDGVPQSRKSGVSSFDGEGYPMTKVPDPYFFDPADIDGLFKEVKQMKKSSKPFSNSSQHGPQSNTGVPKTPYTGIMVQQNTPSSIRDDKLGAKQSSFGLLVPSQSKKRRLENYDGTLAPFPDLGYDPQTTVISTVLLDVYSWVGEQYFQTLLVELVTEMSFGAGAGDQKNYMNYIQGRRPMKAFTDAYPHLLRIWRHVFNATDKVVKLHIGAFVENHRNSLGVLCEKNSIELKRWFNCVLGREFKEFLEREKIIRDQEREKAQGMMPLAKTHRLTPPMWQWGDGDTNMGGGWQW